MLSIKKILAPIDFTQTSSRSCDYAVELAVKFEAALTIVHVYQVPLYTFPDGVLVTPADLATELSNKAQKNLDEVVTQYKGRGIPITGQLVNGVSWEEIARLTEEDKYDLVVMGTHGRRGLPRALMGSVAENVIRTSPVPVLVVHGAN
jgi:nucleotide-binding universal stress UspA family protein